MAGQWAPCEQATSPAAVLAHNLNLPFPPAAHAFIFSAAFTLGVALTGARAAAGEAGTRLEEARPSLVAPERPPPPAAAASAPERRQPRPPRPQRQPPPMAIAGGEAAAAAAPAAAPPPPSAYMHLTQSVLASLFEVAYGRTADSKNKTWLTRKLSEAGAPMVVPPGFVPTARVRAEAWRVIQAAEGGGAGVATRLRRGGGGEGGGAGEAAAAAAATTTTAPPLPPPPPPAERHPAPPHAAPDTRPPRAVLPRTARLRIGKMSVTHNRQGLPTELVHDLLAGVNSGDTVTLVSQGGAAPGAPRTFNVVYRINRASKSASGIASYFTAGWHQFLEAHRLKVGQKVVFQRLGRRGGHVVLDTRIVRNTKPLGGPSVPRAPQTRPGRLRVVKSTQVLTVQFVNDILAGVHPGDIVTLVGLVGAGGAVPLTFDVTYSQRLRTNHGPGICHYFISGWSQFVEAHAMKVGQVVDFERVGRRGGLLVLRVRRIIRNPVQRPQ